MKTGLRSVPLAVGMTALGPSLAQACSTCFSKVQTPMTEASAWAVLTMLGITAGVLAGFGAFMICLVRRARSAGGGLPALAAACLQTPPNLPFAGEEKVRRTHP